MLKTFVAVADTGSFAAAAERVALTPAAVGAQMKSLEDEFKRPLFARARRGATFTPAGLALVPRARQLVKDYESMLAATASGSELAGTVTIGAIVSAMAALAGSVVELKTPYPALEIRIVNGRQPDLRAQVLAGRLDAAILVETQAPDPDTALWTPLYAEPLMLVASAHAVAAAPAADPIALLRSRPFIRFERHATTGAKIEQFLRRHGVQPDEIVEMNSLPAIVDLVRRDIGVAIVPVLHSFAWEQDTALRLLPLPGKPMLRRIGMLEHAGRLAITSVIRAHVVRRLG